MWTRRGHRNSCWLRVHVSSSEPPSGRQQSGPILAFACSRLWGYGGCGCGSAAARLEVEWRFRGAEPIPYKELLRRREFVSLSDPERRRPGANSRLSNYRPTLELAWPKNRPWSPRDPIRAARGPREMIHVGTSILAARHIRDEVVLRHGKKDVCAMFRIRGAQRRQARASGMISAPGTGCVCSKA
jgi:hypothetical protein